MARKEDNKSAYEFVQCFVIMSSVVLRLIDTHLIYRIYVKKLSKNSHNVCEKQMKRKTCNRCWEKNQKCSSIANTFQAFTDRLSIAFRRFLRCHNW